MSSEGYEPAIPPSERPQTHALDRAATGIGTDTKYKAEWITAALQSGLKCTNVQTDKGNCCVN
jgi:tetrahydromethanopterin S-methyltransferase subunit F